MDRRSFLVLLMAGCADPDPNLLPPVVGVPPAPTPGSPEPITPPTRSGDAVFDAWAAAFYARAVKAGLPPQLLDRELAGLTPDPRVADRDVKQPEFAKPFGDYIKGVVNDDRIAIGRRKRAELTPFLGPIETTYGVPPEIVMGVWAMETGFGAMLGNFDVIRSMASLAALRIIGSGEFPRARLTGSWAGAMGQTQFIPTTFLSTAVDGDGDGRRDIWGSSADALASAANLLAKGGWRRGESWAREASLPDGFDYGVTEGPRMIPDAWAALGVRPADNGGWTEADAAAEAMLIAPTGSGGPAFLLFPNHFVIRKYNNATTYALAVGLLADRFAGGGPLIRPWPPETPLSLEDRIASQKALKAVGFDPGSTDGVVGINTRAALRSWQKARGLDADGYLSMDMVQRLKVEAAALPPPAPVN
jgi:membrane-bound lytic murein transglycosylase B